MKTVTISPNTAFVLAALFFALLAPSIAQADTIDIVKYTISYDFELGATQPSPTLCLCSAKADEIIIVNTGTFRAEYEISTNIPSHAQVTIDRISLDPGQERRIPISLSASCTDRERIYDYDVFVRNNFGTEKVVRRNLAVERCQTIDASLFADKNNTLPCEPVNYTLQLNNPSPFEEEYVIRPVTRAEFFSDEAYSLVLPPNRTGVVNTQFFPACDLYGDITNEFLIRSLNNRLEARVSHSLTIQQQYDFSTTIPAETSMCETGTQRIPVEITNDARVTNDFIIETIGAPGFITIPERRITLDPTQTGTLYLEGTPSPSRKGTYEFQIRVRTGIGDIETTQDVKLIVEKCHNPIIIIEAPDKDSTGVNEYPARILNDGTRATNFSINSFPLETTFIDINNLYLEPGQEETVLIGLIARDDETPQKYMTVGITLVHPEIDVAWTQEKTIQIYNQYASTLPEIRPSRITARHGDETASITITNRGIKTTNYTISLTGTDFVSLEQQEIFLGPGESKELILLLYQDDSNETEHNFALSIESGNNVVYEEYFSLRLIEHTWYERAYFFVAANIMGIVWLLLLLILLLLIVLAIIKLLKRRKPRKKRVVLKEVAKKPRRERYVGPVTGYRLILLILIILLFLAIPLIYGVPEPLQPLIPKEVREDPMHIAWLENETHWVDLTEYFYDPDSDELVFFIESHPQNIDAVIDNNMLVLTPEESWTGVDSIVLLASDQRSGITESPPIKLEVVEVPVYTESELFAFYAPYIYGLIIIIILLIIFLLPLRKKPLPEKKVAVKKKKAARKRKK